LPAQRGQSGSGKGIVRLQVQHILQADTFLIGVIYHATQPQPGQYVRPVSLKRLLQPAPRLV
jgi:hypothetical protein